MKKKSKFICIILGLVLLISCSYNFYQYKKINNYKNKLIATIRLHIQHFVALSDDIDNETIYAEKYASLVTAKEAYIDSRDTHMIPSDEWAFSLLGLFVKLESLIINDKKKFKEVSPKLDSSELLFKISNNLEDKDSINKVHKLLNE